MSVAPPPVHSSPQLIAYADRLGGSIARLTELLRGPLRGAFGGVHLLPFSRPYDGAAAGFDPEEHTYIDARLGASNDSHALADTHTVISDVIVNHITAHSAQFRYIIADCYATPH